MATWKSKKIADFLNKKIRKKPCAFTIIDEETVGLANFWRTTKPVENGFQIDNIISNQEMFNYQLIQKIKTLLSDYNHKIHVILDESGNVSIIICKWTYRDTIPNPPAQSPASIEIQRNTPKRRSK